MKLVKHSEAVHFSNSNTCVGVEYPLNDKDINFAFAEITGRYPDFGYCVNEECKELVYVIEGYGTLTKKDGSKVEFEEKDIILIDKKEPFYWDGKCKILMPCTPSWYPEQHKLID